jgi:hypothetical protein
MTTAEMKTRAEATIHVFFMSLSFYGVPHPAWPHILLLYSVLGYSSQWRSIRGSLARAA